MPRIAYVNGRYLPHSAASVHIEDRGYQFADGIYEVTPVYRGRIVNQTLHLDRLERSLRELRIAMPASRAGLVQIAHETMRRNHLTNGFVYIQITRGVAPRDHKFPKPPVRPSLVMTARQMKTASDAQVAQGLKVVTLPDLRWPRRDIKSISLLPNCLAKQQAYEAGANEAWLYEGDGTITEGSSTSAWIVTREGTVVTRNADHLILNGVTRQALLKAARGAGIAIEERPFTRAEAAEAREAFLTSATNFVMPIVEIDGRPVGNGHPGLLTMRLRRLYLDEVVAGAA